MSENDTALKLKHRGKGFYNFSIIRYAELGKPRMF